MGLNDAYSIVRSQILLMSVENMSQLLIWHDEVVVDLVKDCCIMDGC
ncbi:hypothetical protein Pint_17536 [Pistacia integerrima]|uniref:Uncharacterized protein n=1 Tax=Pistacia integerrima TaxID=434235 RepID=A0ACC0YZ13_9ROSI|nr:hypothetical protein Pint_17536 [Pistacia integerrima]